MKYFLSIALLSGLSTAAYAADLPSRLAPPAAPPPPIFTWTGFYMGAQAGYAFGKTDTALNLAGGGPFVGAASTSPSGFIGGLHMGYDWEIPTSFSIGSRIVLGLEGDLEGAGYRKTGLLPGPDVLTGASATTLAQVFGSLRGRLGFAIDRTLIYATGGLAFTSFRNTVVNAAGTDGDWRDKTGWTVGGGVEYAIDPHWSVRAEYRYDDYGSYSQNLVNTTAMVYDARHRETMQRVEAGFSYKFNTTAPTAFLASAK